MSFLRHKLFRRTAISAGTLAAGYYWVGPNGDDNLVSMASNNPTLQAKQSTPLDFQFINDKRSRIARDLKTRDQHLNEIETSPEYDVVIIGGGCTGAGVAINTSAAGLRTLLIEAHDFGSGTSSKSTKLLHGGRDYLLGYRYFQQIFDLNFKFKLKKENYGLVKEGVEERDTVINNTPHSTRYIGLCVPAQNIIMAGYYYIGLWLYHHLSLRFLADTSEFSCPSPRLIGQNELQGHFPLLNKKFSWGVVVYDGEMDDTRLLIETLLTSTLENYRIGMRGANILNYAQFQGFLKDTDGKINGIEFLDKVGGKSFKIKSKHVVNATGNFGDVVRQMDDPQAKPRIIHSLGSHIMLDGAFCSRDMGILIPKTTDGRVLFIVPWLQSTIIGTTDVVINEPRIHPIPTPECMDFLKKQTSEIYPIFETKPVNDYIRSKWAGIRPLVLQNDTPSLNPDGTVNTKEVSRVHVVLESPSGLISVMGGKWTIYRRMGEDTLLHILRKSQPNLKEVPKEASTKNLRTLGDYRNTTGTRLHVYDKKDHKDYLTKFVKELYSRHSSLGLPLLNHLARAYGVRSLDIIELISKNPKLAERIHPEFDVTKAEIIYQIRKEMVVNVFDIALRRNRLAFLDSKATEEALPHLIDLLGTEKGWNDATKKQHYLEAQALFAKMEF